jgi:glucosylceramidase
MNVKIFIIAFLFIVITVISSLNCCKTPIVPIIDPPDTTKIINEIDVWITSKDGKQKLEKQTSKLSFKSENNFYETIELDSTSIYQSIDGFGYTLTGGSAKVLNKLNSDVKLQLIEELFGKKDNSISVSFLRLSVGASDLNDFPFTYNDLQNNETDPFLEKFSLSYDLIDLIPLIKEILKVNPEIKFLASPWSPPAWMKDNKDFKGGSLLPQYYDVYAGYFVKYIKTMAENGINIYAVTPQNEPLHPGNNPSMLMTAVEQAKFIKNNLGPAFKNNNLDTKIIIYDHNCDRPDYPKTILDDPEARKYVDGTAFHLYAGDISTLSYIHDQYPEKNLYFTEQYTASNGDFGGDLNWHLKNVIIGSMRNWSKVALEWNLANDPDFKPHTDGGCSTCKGAITVLSKDAFTRNVSYYIIAHVSKFVPPGSVRILSTLKGNLQNVAFLTPAGNKVLIVLNNGSGSEVFNIKYNGKWATTSLKAGDVATYIWK